MITKFDFINQRLIDYAIQEQNPLMISKLIEEYVDIRIRIGIMVLMVLCLIEDKFKIQGKVAALREKIQPLRCLKIIGGVIVIIVLTVIELKILYTNIKIFAIINVLLGLYKIQKKIMEKYGFDEAENRLKQKNPIEKRVKNILKIIYRNIQIKITIKYKFLKLVLMEKKLLKKDVCIVTGVYATITTIIGVYRRELLEIILSNLGIGLGVSLMGFPLLHIKESPIPKIGIQKVTQLIPKQQYSNQPKIGLANKLKTAVLNNIKSQKNKFDPKVFNQAYPNYNSENIQKLQATKVISTRKNTGIKAIDMQPMLDENNKYYSTKILKKAIPWLYTYNIESSLKQEPKIYGLINIYKNADIDQDIVLIDSEYKPLKKFNEYFKKSPIALPEATKIIAFDRTVVTDVSEVHLQNTQVKENLECRLRMIEDPREREMAEKALYEYENTIREGRENLLSITENPQIREMFEFSKSGPTYPIFSREYAAYFHLKHSFIEYLQSLPEYAGAPDFRVQLKGSPTEGLIAESDFKLTVYAYGSQKEKIIRIQSKLPNNFNGGGTYRRQVKLMRSDPENHNPQGVDYLFNGIPSQIEISDLKKFKEADGNPTFVKITDREFNNKVLNDIEKTLIPRTENFYVKAAIEK